MEKHILKLNKSIRTSAENAFEAFADPDHLSRWFTTKAEAEFRVGGKYSNADGDKGEFVKIEPPRRIVFTWDNENHCPGTMVDITFASEGDNRVSISLEHSKLSSKKDIEDMETGWSWALASLKSYLETGKPIPFEDWKKSR